MASPPITNREFAYFYISGSGRHESISDLLGLAPTQAWNVGDAIGETSRTRETMRWRLDSGLDDKNPLAAHLEALLWKLLSRESKLRELSLDYDHVLQCVGHYPPSGHGVHLGRETVRQAARLGAAFDLDFYYLDESE